MSEVITPPAFSQCFKASVKLAWTLLWLGAASAGSSLSVSSLLAAACCWVVAMCSTCHLHSLHVHRLEREGQREFGWGRQEELVNLELCLCWWSWGSVDLSATPVEGRLHQHSSEFPTDPRRLFDLLFRLSHLKQFTIFLTVLWGGLGHSLG